MITSNITDYSYLWGYALGYYDVNLDHLRKDLNLKFLSVMRREGKQDGNGDALAQAWDSVVNKYKPGYVNAPGIPMDGARKGDAWIGINYIGDASYVYDPKGLISLALVACGIPLIWWHNYGINGKMWDNGTSILQQQVL